MQVSHVVRYISEDTAEIKAFLSKDKSREWPEIQLLLNLERGKPAKCEWSLHYAEEDVSSEASLPLIHRVIGDYVKHLKVIIDDSFIDKVLAKDGVDMIENGLIGLGLSNQLRR